MQISSHDDAYHHHQFSEALTHRGQIKNQIKHHKRNFITIHTLKITDRYDLYKKIDQMSLTEEVHSIRFYHTMRHLGIKLFPAPADVGFLSEERCT